MICCGQGTVPYRFLTDKQPASLSQPAHLDRLILTEKRNGLQVTFDPTHQQALKN